MASDAVNPRDLKMALAREIVRLYHGEEEAIKAEESFKSVFQKGQLPDEIPEVEIHSEDLDNGAIWIAKLLVVLGLSPSTSEARRNVMQGAVKVNEEKVTDVKLNIQVKNGDVVQVGKRKIAKIKL